jgi:protein O-mannosyl-transferase
MKTQQKKTPKRTQPAPGKPSTEGALLSRFETMKPVYLFPFIIGMILVVYFQSMSYDYSGFDDDELVRDNATLFANPSSIGKIFLTDVSLGSEKPTFYRPLQVLSYIADTMLGGASPASYHVSNVLLHCAVVCALLYLLVSLGLPRMLSFISSLLFAVHPVFVQSVVWIPSRGDLLIALFGILSFLAFLKYRESGNILFIFLHGVAILLAFFSKETAILFPFVFIAYALLFDRKKKPMKAMLPFAVLWCLLFVFWFLLRSKAITGAQDGPLKWIVVLAQNLRTIPEMLYTLFLPVHVSPMPSFTALATVAGALVMAALVYWAVRSGRIGNRLFLFGTIWFFVTIVPGMMYRHAMGGYAYDYLMHRLYLPAPGLIIALLACVPKQRAAGKNILLYAGATIIALFGFYSWSLAKNYKDWQSFYEYATTSNPTSAVAWNNRGNRRLDVGNLDGAFSDLSRALSLAPTYTYALNNMGNLYEKRGRYKDAMEQYSAAVRSDPGVALCYYNRGYVYTRSGDYSSAIKDFNAALERKPSMYKAYNNRGVSRSLLGDGRGAFEDFNEALKLKPDFAEALTNRGREYTAMKRFEEAEKDFRTAIRVNPDFGESYIELGNMYAVKENTDASMKSFSEAIAAKPAYAEAYIARGLLKRRLNDFKGAIEDLDQAVRVNPQSPAAYCNRGTVLEAMNKLQESEKDFSEALRIDPSFSLGFRNRGLIRLKLKNPKGAREDWEQALRLGDTGAAALLKQYGQ